MPDPAATAAVAPRRILVRGVNWLGDAVMTTPALLRLRERFPEAHITLLTRDTLRDLWGEHPAVNETISFSAGGGLYSIAHKLRAGSFDLALVLPNSPRSALEVWLGRIPRRVGYSRPWRDWLLNEAVPPRAGAVKMHKRSPGEINELIQGRSAPPAPQAHQVHEYLHLAAALGANPEPLRPRLEMSPAAVEAARARFELDPRIAWFALNPGAEYGPAKRWPAERFAAAAREIQQRTQCGWVILGGPGDVAVASEIESQIRLAAPKPSEGGNPQSAIRNLAGRTSLMELMAVSKLSRVLLTNDTGPMHVAAALGTPVVVLFGSTSPELTGPGLPGERGSGWLRADAACSPCFLRECPIDFRCMTGITTDRAIAAVIEAVNIEH